MRSVGSSLLAAATALGSLTLLAACGQKGPLYLPDRGTVITRPAGSAAPGTAPAQGQQTTTPPQSSSPTPADQAQPNQPPTDPSSQKPDDRKDEADSQAHPHP
ncbi:MAG TPA: lipoprotein [Steroidobacteraceae bacterium]